MKAGGRARQGWPGRTTGCDPAGPGGGGRGPGHFGHADARPVGMHPEHAEYPVGARVGGGHEHPVERFVRLALGQLGPDQSLGELHVPGRVPPRSGGMRPALPSASRRRASSAGQPVNVLPALPEQVGGMQQGHVLVDRLADALIGHHVPEQALPLPGSAERRPGSCGSTPWPRQRFPDPGEPVRRKMVEDELRTGWGGASGKANGYRGRNPSMRATNASNAST